MARDTKWEEMKNSMIETALADKKELADKRKDMQKASWIKNITRIHPEKSVEEVEALYARIFEKPVIGSNGIINAEYKEEL